VASLAVSTCATQEAQRRAQDLVGKPLQHAPLEPVQRMCGTTYVGENLAQGYRSPADTVQAWVNSSGHARNLFDPLFRFLAVGCAGSGSQRVCVQIFHN